MLKLLVERKKIDIQECDRTISVSGEDNIERVLFVFPTRINSEIDLTGAVCTLTWQNALGTNIITPEITSRSNRTEVLWVFAKYETAAAGMLQFFIDFTKTDGINVEYTYRTFINYFIIARTLPQGDPPPNPPNLWNQLVAAGQYAHEQGDYANVQGDYANSEGNYAHEQGLYAGEQGDFAKDMGDYAKEIGDETGVALADILALIPEGTTAENKLTNKSSVQDLIDDIEITFEMI